MKIQDAEEIFVGGCLAFPDRLLPLINLVTPEDICSPICRDVWRAIQYLHAEGVRPDMVTVADVAKREQAAVLELQLNSLPPTVDHAAIIRRESCRRRSLILLDEFQHRVAQPDSDPYALAGELVENLKAAQRVLLRATPEHAPTATVAASDDALAPWVIPGLLRRDWRCVIVAAEGKGKALATDTPILTTQGWKTMGSVTVGDQVFGPDGKATPILACSQVMTERPCYRVTFDDGAEIVADENHLWWTVSYSDRQRGAWLHGVHTTAEIRATLEARGGHTKNHAIECAEPPDMPEAPLPVEPYTLGAWLGDGTSRSGQITSVDPEICDRIRADGWHVERRHRCAWLVTGNRALGPAGPPRSIGRAPSGRRTRALSLAGRLRALGVLGNKHIPEVYLTASVEQRLDLLRGLMDTDGTVGTTGEGNGRGFGAARCELTLTCERLAADALRLIWSLGIKATCHESDATLNSRVVSRRWRIAFQTNLAVFHLSRKLQRMTPLRTRRSRTRYVSAVTPVQSVPVRCIQVGNATGVFLAGDRLVPTHNSVLLRQICMLAAQGVHPLFPTRRIPPVRTLIVDLENPVAAIAETGRPMAERLRSLAGYDPTRCDIWMEPGGIDLRTPAGAGALEREVNDFRPDLVALGPLYKTTHQRPRESWEDVAAGVQAVLDDLRTRYGFALLLEHHAPQEDGPRRKMRPYGSSLWLRWPEFGIGLEADMKLTRWRGDRLTASWPQALERSKEWPFIGIWDKGFSTGAQEDF